MRPHLVPLMGHEFDGNEGVPRYTLYHRCNPSQKVELCREPHNTNDQNAVVAIAETPEGKKFDLGYIPRALAVTVSAAIADGKKFDAQIAELRLDEKDPRKRIVVLKISEVAPPASQALSGPIAVETPSLQSANQYLPAIEPATVTRVMKRGPVPIWVDVYCVLTFGFPLLGTLGIYGAPIPAIPIAVRSLGLLNILLAAITGLMVWFVVRGAMRMLKLYIVFSVFCHLIFLSAMALDFGSQSEADRNASTDADGWPLVIALGLAPLAFQIIAYLYFHKSRRIKAAYGRNL